MGRGKIKKGMLGGAGIHFKDYEKTDTVITGMLVICHEETDEVLDILVKSFIDCLERITGVSIRALVSDWYWDGRAGADTVFTKHVLEALCHVCLQYARMRIKDPCSFGFKQALPVMIDMIAFVRLYHFMLQSVLFCLHLSPKAR